MDSRINWLLLINAALGNFMAGTANRIFTVSLPTVANSLETSIVAISWAVIAYQISQISLSLVFGRVGDIYGRHTLFGLGLVVSSVAALLCGLSQNVTQLIIFRLFQGVGASMTQSQGRALAMESMPKESSGRAQGYMTTAFHSGVLIGPSVGGIIIDTIHWRAVFFFLIPIGVCGILLTLFNRMKGNTAVRSIPPGPQPAIDYFGAILLVAATVALIASIDHRIMEAAGPVMRVVFVAGLALWGLATALFFTANHTAMITSVPTQHRGVATGAIYVMFGLGTTFGVSLGTLLLTAAFRYYSDDPTATPTPANAAVFVQAMNFSFFTGGIMALVAILCSAMRGKGAAANH
ncbi:MAG: MFS transporter [Candidatus Binatia bacterium]